MHCKAHLKRLWSSARVHNISALHVIYAAAHIQCMQVRHDVGNGAADAPAQAQGIVSKWRQKERLKTTAVALVLCLNIGVDPPDVIKISPCARLECWVDPLSMQPPKALETIGAGLGRDCSALCHTACGGVSVADTCA